MTTTAPTPEEFLSSPPDPEEDEETVETPAPTPTADAGHQAPRDSLASIADSVGRIASSLTHQQVTATNEATQPLLRHIEELEQENCELESLHDAKQGLIEQVLALIKPSTSKLANSIRSVLEPVVVPAPEPAEDPTPEPPADDAPIEDWLAFAQARGLEVDPGRTNRAQIRTMLGIPQPIKSTVGGE